MFFQTLLSCQSQEIKLVGSSNVEMGEPYTAITIDGGFMYNSDYEGVKFKKVR